jgi:hypothetical protein
MLHHAAVRTQRVDLRRPALTPGRVKNSALREFWSIG